MDSKELRARFIRLSSWALLFTGGDILQSVIQVKMVFCKEKRKYGKEVFPEEKSLRKNCSRPGHCGCTGNDKNDELLLSSEFSIENRNLLTAAEGKCYHNVSYENIAEYKILQGEMK